MKKSIVLNVVEVEVQGNGTKYVLVLYDIFICVSFLSSIDRNSDRDRFREREREKEGDRDRDRERERARGDWGRDHESERDRERTLAVKDSKNPKNKAALEQLRRERMALVKRITQGDSDDEVEKKPMSVGAVKGGGEVEDGEDEEEEDIMALMGFGGFDTTKAS